MLCEDCVKASVCKLNRGQDVGGCIEYMHNPLNEIKESIRDVRKQLDQLERTTNRYLNREPRDYI